MKIFVTGASGWIGSSVVPELIARGHQVTGLARSDASAAAIEAMGASVLRGDTDDTDILREGAIAADGVINLAFKHNFGDFAQAGADEARTVQVLGEALEGTGKALVISSGTPSNPGSVTTEQDNPAPVGPAAARAATVQIALDFASRGVRVSVVRLPRSVHGEGDGHGFIPRLVDFARENGVAPYLADGSQRWPAVHEKDAAHLFVLAVENAPAGSILHAVGDEGVTTFDIATAIGMQLGMPAEARTAEEIGFVGMVLSVDQASSAPATRALLNWEPTHPTLLEDIAAGYYTHPVVE